MYKPICRKILNTPERHKSRSDQMERHLLYLDRMTQYYEYDSST